VYTRLPARLARSDDLIRSVADLLRGPIKSLIRGRIIRINADRIIIMGSKPVIAARLKWLANHYLAGLVEPPLLINDRRN
jgi:hypothetical protein